MSTASFAIEMATWLDNSEYGKVHKAGCKDLKDGVDFESEATKEAASAAASEESGWEGEPWKFAPCTKELFSAKATRRHVQSHDLSEGAKVYKGSGKIAYRVVSSEIRQGKVRISSVSADEGARGVWESVRSLTRES